VHQERAKLRGAGSRVQLGILQLEEAERKNRKQPKGLPVCAHCNCTAGKGLVLAEGRVVPCFECAEAAGAA